jgi:hypothetical protein
MYMTSQKLAVLPPRCPGGPVVGIQAVGLEVGDIGPIPHPHLQLVTCIRNSQSETVTTFPAFYGTRSFVILSQTNPSTSSRIRPLYSLRLILPSVIRL